MATTHDARVYDSYDMKNPPAHPGPDWTRFVCISDTHSHACAVPQGDVLLHGGDLTSWGYTQNLEKTVKWLERLPHPCKIIIAGNHDLCLDEKWVGSGEWYITAEGKSIGGDMNAMDLEAGRALVRGEASVKAGLHYLEYESFKFVTSSGRTWEVYGSPAAPRYALGSFQYTEDSGEGEALYKQIPSSTEILLTHTPPHGICDKTRRGVFAGCPELTARMNEPDLKRCRLHVFGHIHEAHGFHISEEHGRVSVNAAVHGKSLPIIVDLLN